MRPKQDLADITGLEMCHSVLYPDKEEEKMEKLLVSVTNLQATIRKA
jgi:hypothetical protein